MATLLLTILCFFGFIIAYNTYGRFLARKIFNLDPEAPVPSKEMHDGVDYVACKRGIVFGHHFTSIAGTGPIVGPAIGIIWGWLPALLWVLIGCIFVGAVHDFGALVVSMRNQGKSISEMAARYINPRVRFAFFFVVFLALLIIIAVFGMVIAIIFKIFPSSILPVWMQIPIAMLLAFAIYKKNAKTWLATLIAVIFMYAFIFLGAFLEDKMPGMTTIPDTFAIPSTGIWTILLLSFAFIASAIPVTAVLVPRGYINAWQLGIMMLLIVAGVVGAATTGNFDINSAPMINKADTGAPPLWPFMFVTIACGAVSGFHSLVSSGTSPKQIETESDSLFIGYGSMLMEGALAVLVLLCVSAGIGMFFENEAGQVLTGSAAWQSYYASWAGVSGLGAKLAAVVKGAANMLQTIGIPKIFGIVLMGVFIASFAGTTLDTAVRLQRYIIGEIAFNIKFKPLQNKWVATIVAVATALGLAFATGADGKGALKLWPLFGIVNQLLASLALLVVSMYVKSKFGGKKYLLTLWPCFLMAVITIWALIIKFRDFYTTKQWLLVIVSGIIFALVFWVLIEGIIVFSKKTEPAKIAA